jgi:4-hydroxythreonine-4-phosphate dehydrogenase
MSLLRIGITLGDPGGIGPEIVVRALSAAFATTRSSLATESSATTRSAAPTGLSVATELAVTAGREFVIFGDPDVLRSEADRLGLILPPVVFSSRDSRPARPSGRRGFPDPENGAASFRWFEDAVAAARVKEIGAIVTAPVSKKSWQLAGLPWRGHTEYLASLYPGAIMTFWSDRLTVALFSHHVPLREAAAGVTKAALLGFFGALRDGVAAVSPGPHEFLVAGLNPHAGEDGLLGREESEVIEPAIREARESGIPVAGPFAPDVVFRSALGRPEKVVVALYHDQGLIPFKLVAFENGVNATLGMPFLRTSPDHGTAFDIVGKRPADPRSMIAALRLAGYSAPRPL